MNETGQDQGILPRVFWVGVLFGFFGFFGYLFAWGFWVFWVFRVFYESEELNTAINKKSTPEVLMHPNMN